MDQDNSIPMAEMPRYQSYKKVRALKIKDVTGTTITPDDKNYAPITLDPEVFLRYTPVPGDYYVVYEDGYKSFSPGKAFEEGYTWIGDGNGFGWALKQLHNGRRVARTSWNGKGMFLVFVSGTPDCALREGTPYHNALSGVARPNADGTFRATINPHIDLYTAGGHMQPGWLASQADMLAGDWVLVD